MEDYCIKYNISVEDYKRDNGEHRFSGIQIIITRLDAKLKKTQAKICFKKSIAIFCVVTKIPFESLIDGFTTQIETKPNTFQQTVFFSWEKIAHIIHGNHMGILKDF